ncbi:MAG TPA: patatin-like phospholipase family protein [Gemmataceae bacterium]|jgi:predicted acylesterase/phospholipase RssA
MSDDPRATAVVLSGGASYAAYQVGVLRALAEGCSPATGCRPLRASIFVGTSAGAINAAAAVARPEPDLAAVAGRLERLWLEEFAADPARCRDGALRIRGDPATYWRAACRGRRPLAALARLAADGLTFANEFVARAGGFAASEEPLARRVLEAAGIAPVIARDNFERIVAQVIDLAAIRRSHRLLRITATDWYTGELKVFANQDMTDDIGHKAIFASAAFPGTPPVDIGDTSYVDGSYVAAMPTSPAWQAGARTTHVVYMDPTMEDTPAERFDNSIDVLDKVYHFLTATIFARDVQLARDINRGLDLLDRPDRPGGLSPLELRGILRLAGRGAAAPAGSPPFRKLVMHLYHPTDDLGGAVGLVNFDRDHVAWLIGRGYEDAAGHDCAKSGCLLD